MVLQLLYKGVSVGVEHLFQLIRRYSEAQYPRLYEKALAFWKVHHGERLG